MVGGFDINSPRGQWDIFYFDSDLYGFGLDRNSGRRVIRGAVGCSVLYWRSSLNRRCGWSRHSLSGGGIGVVRIVLLVIRGKVFDLNPRFWFRAIHDGFDEVPTELIHDIRNLIPEALPVTIEVSEAEPFLRLACTEADKNVAGIRCDKVSCPGRLEDASDSQDNFP